MTAESYPPRMATPPKPVPWEEVVDLCGDLLEWLVAKGLADRGDDFLGAMVNAHRRADPTDSLAHSVAQALWKLISYMRAGDLKDLQPTVSSLPFAEAQKTLFLDFSIEIETEEEIRALRTRFVRVRRMMRKVISRRADRIACFPIGTELDRLHQEATVAAVMEHLEAAEKATGAFHTSFQRLNPVGTEFPLTFKGWGQFRDALRAELTAIGFVWPD